MPSDPLILAFDTSAAHCAAALLSGDQVLGVDVNDMARGQAEHLFPLIENLLGAHGVPHGSMVHLGRCTADDPAGSSAASRWPRRQRWGGW